jgi:predicted nucleic acid-binding protein
MNGFLLDTSALLTLRDNEPGAEQVSQLLLQAQNGGLPCYGCFMTLMEVFYRVWKDEGESAGREAYADCQALPINWLHESPELLIRAASVKATHPLSLADAWIAAAALENSVALVHKDPEFENLPGLLEERLPYK